ncbi:phosphatidylinositol-specific phospholipase C domain-containing protein [Longimicrobium sp.]|uniref:phosphatidylinositol-specific phospholipase C domain-containing protein n=1 Tax=Longimicrobium sp. TaxID=2029185 RepID=UPI002E3381C5|nr:phosphatidylinositol-specific phospholipase C domain-containing protein [Longimicrobium sp.]HEX6039212.1 phosphatidylinositol-specific phospholipase C domain-containing protein [Longimicrobium sp.]
MSVQKTWSTNWMSAIEDGTSIAEISIPGTHESCARFGGSASQCQWFSITQQLNRGIRFLDIRCKYETGADSGRTQGIYFPVYHGTDPFLTSRQNILFEEVQAQCIAFLAENPTEFILMNVQMEYGCEQNQDGCGDQFREKFLELTRPYWAKYWYMKSSIPLIDDCRGRIVLIRAYDPAAQTGWGSGIHRGNPVPNRSWPDGNDGGGLAWNGFNTDGDSTNLHFRTQNGWTLHGTPKGGEVERHIDAAQANARAGFITLNFASYAGDSGPGGNAAGMNVRLQNYLRNYRQNGNWGVALGVIPIDFTGNTGDGNESLENLIIEHQAHQDPNTSYSGLPGWLLRADA